MRYGVPFAGARIYADETRIPTRDEFFAQKDDDPYIRYLFSFGNNGRDYLFSRDVEEVKVCASRMLVAPTLHRARRGRGDSGKAEAVQRLREWQRPEGH